MLSFLFLSRDMSFKGLKLLRDIMQFFLRSIKRKKHIDTMNQACLTPTCNNCGNTALNWLREHSSIDLICYKW